MSILFIQHGFVINIGEPNVTSSLDRIHHSKLKVSIFFKEQKNDYAINLNWILMYHAGCQKMYTCVKQPLPWKLRFSNHLMKKKIYNSRFHHCKACELWVTFYFLLRVRMECVYIHKYRTVHLALIHTHSCISWKDRCRSFSLPWYMKLALSYKKPKFNNIRDPETNKSYSRFEHKNVMFWLKIE